MWKNLFSHINIDKANIHIPDENTPDVPAFCHDYENRIKQAGLAETLNRM